MIKRNKAYNNADTYYTHGWEDSTQNTAKFQQKCFFFYFYFLAHMDEIILKWIKKR